MAKQKEKDAKQEPWGWVREVQVCKPKNIGAGSSPEPRDRCRELDRAWYGQGAKR